jgi:propionyl-CoA carboxylase alpha chain
VLSVHVEPGDEVTDGQLLVVVEAMKMEHKITAPGPGTVTEVRVAPGQRVDAGEVLALVEHDGHG